MTESEPTLEKKTPTCYRHPDRETWVTCGRCGKPLCPDCMMHGPVGVRCRECLLPQGKGIVLLEATQIRRAGRIAALVAVGWIFLLSAVTVIIGFTQVGLLKGGVWTPNILLSMIAGGMVGWVIWRICQRTWNAATIRTAALLGASIPVLATIVVSVLLVRLTGSTHFISLSFIIRALLATILSTGMALLLASNNT